MLTSRSNSETVAGVGAFDVEQGDPGRAPLPSSWLLIKELWSPGPAWLKPQSNP